MILLFRTALLGSAPQLSLRLLHEGRNGHGRGEFWNAVILAKQTARLYDRNADDGIRYEMKGETIMLKFFAWIFSVVFAFNLGAGVRSENPTDSELQQKIQEHMDVIMDESAAMVDDVVEELRKNEDVQKAEEFVNDVQEIVDNTMADIEAHFGTPEENTEETAQEETESTQEIAPAEETGD